MLRCNIYISIVAFARHALLGRFLPRLGPAEKPASLFLGVRIVTGPREAGHRLGDQSLSVRRRMRRTTSATAKIVTGTAMAVARPGSTGKSPTSFAPLNT